MTSADIRQEGRLSKVETYRFAVEPFHVDFTGRLFMGVLGNHLLNAAGHHSHNRGGVSTTSTSGTTHGCFPVYASNSARCLPSTSMWKWRRGWKA